MNKFYINKTILVLFESIINKMITKIPKIVLNEWGTLINILKF
jgi:hypothetical protein